MKPDLVYAVDDVWAGDDTNADRKKCNDDANRDVPEDDGRPGFPHKVKYRRNIFERAHSIAPGAALSFMALVLGSSQLSVRLECPVGQRYRFPFVGVRTPHIASQEGMQCTPDAETKVLRD